MNKHLTTATITTATRTTATNSTFLCPEQGIQSTMIRPTDVFAPSYIGGSLTGKPQTASAAPSTTLKPAKSTDKTKTLLPIDFGPTAYSVICGNKRSFFNSAGNRRFRVICQLHLQEFMNAPSKHEKSFVVTKVMKALRGACPVGAFVTFEKGRWWEVSDRTSREKVGTFFRDCLSDSYKSSSKNKIAQRKKKRAEYASFAVPPVQELLFGYTSPLFEMKPASHSTHSVANPALPATSISTEVPIAPLTAPMANIGVPMQPLNTQTTRAHAAAPSAPLDQNIGSAAASHMMLTLRHGGDLASLAGDDRSSGSSEGSFYDVDDLTPISL